MFTRVYLAVSSDELLRGRMLNFFFLPVTNWQRLPAYRKHGDARVPIMRRDRMAAQQKGGGYQRSVLQVSSPENISDSESGGLLSVPQNPRLLCRAERELGLYWVAQRSMTALDRGGQVSLRSSFTSAWRK